MSGVPTFIGSATTPQPQPQGEGSATTPQPQQQSKNQAKRQAKKERKAKKQESAPQQQRKPTEHKYEEIKDKLKTRFLIDTENFQSYRDVIQWLRRKCYGDRVKAEGIPSWVNVKGIPSLYKSSRSGLVEIEVVSTKRSTSVKFIIRRRDFYVIAFKPCTSTSKTWYHYKPPPPEKGGGGDIILFNHGTKLTKSTELSLSCDYHDLKTDQPWRDIGVTRMTEALEKMCDTGSPDLGKKALASQVFFFYLSEAARFRPIEFMVCNRLHFDDWMRRGNVVDEISDIISKSTEEDLYSLVLPDSTEEGYIRQLVLNYSRLSQLWYANFFKPHVGLDMFKIKSESGPLKGLRMGSEQRVKFALAVLCCPNKQIMSEFLFGKRKKNKKGELIVKPHIINDRDLTKFMKPFEIPWKS